MATPVGPSCFALFVLCICATLAKNVDTRVRRQSDPKANSCDSVIPFFNSKNITVSSFYDNKGFICGGHCCDNETELQLKEQGRRDFAALLRHNSRSLLGPINRTSSILQNHIWELANQSENKTLVLFSQLYRNMAVLSRETIEILYRDIRDYVKIDPNDQKPTKTPDDILKSVERFFTNLFPLAYHQQTGLSSGDFTVKYKQCLKDNMDIIVPFGDIPKDIAQSLSKSLEATRLLLQAFSIGIEVLNTTDTLIIDEHSSTSSECHSALLKMTYCPKCLALIKNSKPCSGYCLNVLRGCISKYVAELDLPWNSYVEGIESLINAMKKTSNEAGVNVDLVIRNLDGQISSAIMYCMEKIKDIDSRVKMNCKIPEFTPKLEALTLETSTTMPSVVKARQPSSRSFPHFPEVHITSFLSIMSKTKGFYANLADNLCGDESFAEQRDKKCWNGERIAEYTKTVVDVGLDMQKYNPEVKTASNLQHVDPRIANLVDKLRQVHHMAISSLGANYAEGDYMQRDGVDGSGSGNGPDFDENDDEYSRGSGSGNGPIESDDDKPTPPRTYSGQEEERSNINVIPKVTGSPSTRVTPTILLTLTLTMLVSLISRN